MERLGVLSYIFKLFHFNSHSCSNKQLLSLYHLVISTLSTLFSYSMRGLLVGAQILAILSFCHASPISPGTNLGKDLARAGQSMLTAIVARYPQDGADTGGDAGDDGSSGGDGDSDGAASTQSVSTQTKASSFTISQSTIVIKTAAPSTGNAP
jgi:hypothetical protein